MNFLQKYKQRECKTFIGKALQLFVFHHLTRLMVFCGLGLIGAVGSGIFFSNALIFQIFLGISLVYLAIFALIGIAYAWIINPIRTWRENHKK